MDEPRIKDDFSDYQDIFGHLIQIRLYTSICVCFSLQDASDRSRIVGTLTEGLGRLFVSFPWLSGQVINDGMSDGNPGLSKIIPLDKTSRLIVKDLTRDGQVPSMEVLRKANFPFSMLDGTVLTPLDGPPISREGDPAPVFFIQANFINRGLLLNFAGEHNAMDGHGLGQVMRLFSKACYNEPFTDEELLEGNRARNGAIPLFDQATYKPGPELEYLIVKPGATSSSASENPPPKCTWAYFHFSSLSLSKLKSIASCSSSISDDPKIPYTTTNDALSAFIWQSTSRIRSSRLPLHTTSTFARAVDVRPCLSIPPSYLGNMSNHTYNTLPLSSISSASLHALASCLRLALNPTDLSFAIRSLATHITHTADKSSITYGANMDFSSDMFFSSWAKLPCFNLDFNLGLGFPESVRRPRYGVLEGLMYLMPMDRKGGIDAAICLCDVDLNGLKEDPEFREYAQWVG